MLTFRKATYKDALAVAELHTISWQENYRGSFSDYYLDNEVLPNRIEVWQERLGNSPENQYVILVEDKGELLGFVCAYLNNDGTYLDNLHVSTKAKGKGIGSKLMGRLTEEVMKHSTKGMYLWVLENNKEAITFYTNLKGKALDKVVGDDIGDTNFIKIRYVWQDLEELQANISAKLTKYEY